MTKQPTTSPPARKSSKSLTTHNSLLAWASVLPSLPSQPGVYWFLGPKNEVLYVGKAKNLKKRVTSYAQVARLSSRISQLVVQAKNLKFSVLDSELEALLTEAELIGTYHPPFNVLLKDDKSPLYIQITDEPFPRVLNIRRKELLTHSVPGKVLGPFPSAMKVREVLQIARCIFPWCNQRGVLTPTKKACFYHHLELCPGACVGKIEEKEYKVAIEHLLLFLRGQKKTVVKQLKDDMKKAVAEEQFEKAGSLRDKISVIEEVTATSYLLKPQLTTPCLTRTAEDGVVYLQKILSKYLRLPTEYPLERIEGYDVSNTSGTLASVAMVTFIDGQPDSSNYRLFNIRTLNTPNDYHMMQEAIIRRQNNAAWGKPDLIVIDGGRGQLRAALSVWNWETPVISIAKNPDRLIIPDLQWSQVVQRDTEDFSHLKNLSYHILKLPETHPALKLIQQIRDEAHRFSKRQHSRRRTKDMFA